nr:L-seryl-tRNA(Sec) selenium transferase [Jatrophihabitans endophyticus]
MDVRRQVPRTDTVLADARLAEAAGRLGRERVKAVVVAAQQQARDGLIAPADVADAAVAALPRLATGLREVVNATGVVLHTNLGRAPLSDAARQAVARAGGYTDVEFDLPTGTRARRGRTAIDALAAAVPRAGGVHVVNNGAAALVLATTALAAGREVIVSRGEMVEIGDGFRLPDLVESTGARLREVGTTNRVRLEDYRQAMGPDTAAVLKVHPSNFVIEGFTSAVPVHDLATLGVPVIADVGSGLLRPHPLLPDEPDVDTALDAGAAVVTCSGDKLLGGPQAGLVFGTAELVDLLRRHPLARALRVDKLTLAALEATVGGPTTPTWTALDADSTTLRERTASLALTLGAQVVDHHGAVGGGGGAGVALPGWAVALPVDLAAALRAGDPPVVGRTAHGHLLLDLRCVPERDDARIAAAVISARARLD